jgi:hypothetical protein
MKAMEANAKLDYKKKYKDLYQPKTTGMLINVAAIPFLMVDGKGNPNEEDGDYSKAMQLLYGITFTIKMSRKKAIVLKGYHDYVVPPLEGLWEMKGIKGVDYSRKEDFLWTSMLRLPEYVTKDVFAWACEEFHKKHPEADINSVRLEWYEEGLCAQILHKGSYDEEPATLKKLHGFIEENGYCVDIGSPAASGQLRKHHEIYLGDPRKCKPENLKTVLRIPIRKQ